MRLHRFLIEEEIPKSGIILVEDRSIVHQWRKVFRLKEGDLVILFNDSGYDHTARIVGFKGKEAEVEIIDRKKEILKPGRNVHLCVSLIKKDKFEWIVEKGTELGITSFTPLISDRSLKNNLNMEKLNKIAKEATEQSGWSGVPLIHNISCIEELLDRRDKKYIILDLYADTDLLQVLDKTNKEEQLVVLIGPEEGWSDEELSLFKKHSVTFATLGKETLKTETAAVAAASISMLLTS